MHNGGGGDGSYTVKIDGRTITQGLPASASDISDRQALIRALRACADGKNFEHGQSERMDWHGSSAIPNLLREAATALEEALADAESWRKQADDRVTDALQFAKERDEARAALEEAQGEPVAWIIETEMQDGSRNRWAHLGPLSKGARDACDFGEPIPLYAAPAAPTREPVSAATPRDEQDARRLDWLERRHVEVWDTDEQGQPYRKLMAAGADKSALRYLVDAALAEPKR